MELRRIIQIFMKIRCLVIWFFCCSCSVNFQEKIVGKRFVFQNEKRVLSIDFISNDTLIIKNLFDCSIDSLYKEISFKSNYSIKKKTIFIANSEEVVFPFIENGDCFFLSEEYRERKKRFYPNGVLVNDNDATLFELPKIESVTILNDSILIFYKEINHSKSFGFIFKLIE